MTWTDLAAIFFESVDLSIFADSWIIGLFAVVTAVLRAKVGILRAVILTPFGILLENTAYNTMEVTPESYMATGLFFVVTFGLIFFFVYLMFIKSSYKEIG